MADKHNMAAISRQMALEAVARHHGPLVADRLERLRVKVERLLVWCVALGYTLEDGGAGVYLRAEASICGDEPAGYEMSARCPVNMRELAGPAIDEARLAQLAQFDAEHLASGLARGFLAATHRPAEVSDGG